MLHHYLIELQIEKLNCGTPADLSLSKTLPKKNGGFLFSIPAVLAAGIGALA